MLDKLHSWKLEIGGVDRTALVRPGSLAWTTREGRELDSLTVALDDRAGVFGSSLAAYAPVVLTADPDNLREQVVFGGYVTASTPEPDPTGQWLSWEVQASGWEVLWDATPRVHRTWLNAEAGVIFSELLTAAGLDTEFDVTNHVEKGPTIEVFTAAGEELTQLCDALAKVAGMVWWCAPSKTAHLAAEDSVTQASPFDVIQPGTLADHDAGKYEIEAGTLRVRSDATGIVNRLRIVGGWALGAPVVDVFAGSDAETVSIGLAFRLSHQNIRSNVTVSLDTGAEEMYLVVGTAFVDYFGKVRTDGSVVQVLVSRINGVVYFPPETDFDPGDQVVVGYQEALQRTLTLDASNSATSAASLAQFGRYFDGDLDADPITDEAEMTALGEAYLRRYAFAVVNGEFATQRLGLKAGQNCGITSARDGLSGRYVLRSVDNELLESGRVRSTARFGGRRESLTRWIGSRGDGARKRALAVGGQDGPTLGVAGALSMVDVLQMLKLGTAWDPSDGGTATGLVLTPATVNEAGRLLGYQDGVVQAAFDSDGAIKVGSGAVLLNQYGIAINATLGKFDGRTVYWVADPTAAPAGQTVELTLGTIVDLGIVTGGKLKSAKELIVEANNGIGIDPGIGGEIILYNTPRIAGLGDATEDTDALNRRTGDARYALKAELYNTTTNAWSYELFLDGDSERLTIPDNTTLYFEVRVAARRTDVHGESAAYHFRGCIDRNDGTVALVGPVAKTVVAEDSAKWDVDITANNVNKTLRIAVTGEAGKTILWKAFVETVEVSG